MFFELTIVEDWTHVCRGITDNLNRVVFKNTQNVFRLSLLARFYASWFYYFAREQTRRKGVSNDGVYVVFRIRMKRGTPLSAGQKENRQLVALMKCRSHGRCSFRAHIGTYRDLSLVMRIIYDGGGRMSDAKKGETRQLVVKKRETATRTLIRVKGEKERGRRRGRETERRIERRGAREKRERERQKIARQKQSRAELSVCKR